MCGRVTRPTRDVRREGTRALRPEAFSMIALDEGGC